MVARKWLWAWVMVAGLALPLTWASNAAGADDALRTELTAAQNEIAQLRSDLAELKSSAGWQYRQELGQAIGQMPTAAKDGSSGGLILADGWSIQPYGYIKLDIVYDDSAVGGGAGEFCSWANSENRQTRSDDRFSITGRQTRLGANIFAPNIGDVKVMGVVETDFYGPTSAVLNENQASLRFRRGFGLLTGCDWSFLFGQEWEVLSPLFPHVLNYTFGSFGGNPGYRSPQATLAKWWNCPDTDATVKLQASIQREIGQDLDALGTDDGQDASMPTFVGRVSYSAPLVGSKKMEVGISGHFGEEEIDWDDKIGAASVAAGAVAGADEDVHTWSLNADLVLPITDEIEVRGEFFWGENLNWPHAAGLAYGVNTITGDEVEAFGGWAQVAYMPAQTPWKFVIGAGLDDPLDVDLQDAQRSQNTWYFGNATYSFSKYLSTGLELSYYDTQYKNADDGDNMRFQHSWVLKF